MFLLHLTLLLYSARIRPRVMYGKQFRRKLLSRSNGRATPTTSTCVMFRPCKGGPPFDSILAIPAMWGGCKNSVHRFWVKRTKHRKVPNGPENEK